MSVNPPEPDTNDDEDDIPLAQLMQEIRPHLPDPVTNVQEYIDLDNQLPANETLTEDWEQQLLDDLKTDRPTETSDTEDQDDNDDLPEPKITTFRSALDWTNELRTFCITNDIPDSLQLISSLQDQLQTKSIERRTQAKQKTITSYFKI